MCSLLCTRYFGWPASAPGTRGCARARVHPARSPTLPPPSAGARDAPTPPRPRAPRGSSESGWGRPPRGSMRLWVPRVHTGRVWRRAVAARGGAAGVEAHGLARAIGSDATGWWAARVEAARPVEGLGGALAGSLYMGIGRDCARLRVACVAQNSWSGCNSGRRETHYMYFDDYSSQR